MPYLNKQNPKKPWMGQIWREGKVWKRKSFLTKKEAIQWEVEEGKRLRSIDTSVRTSGAHISRSDTVQRIAIPAGLLADTRQILFAVLIDQDHEIQT